MYFNEGLLLFNVSVIIYCQDNIRQMQAFSFYYCVISFVCLRKDVLIAKDKDKHTDLGAEGERKQC